MLASLLLLLPLVPHHAATEWTNGWFVTTREAPGSLGQPLVLGVGEDQYSSGASGMNLSHILTPTGATWHISGGGPEADMIAMFDDVWITVKCCSDFHLVIKISRVISPVVK